MAVPTNGQAAACRRRLAAKATIRTLNGGGQPFSSTSLLPFFPLISYHLRPTGLSAPIFSSIPIHPLRRTTITPAFRRQPLFIVLSCVALLSSGPIGPWRSLCFLGARSSQALLQPSRSISSAHFLLLKAVVLAVADGRRPGRRAAAFPAWLMGIPSDARPTCFHHIERAVR